MSKTIDFNFRDALPLMTNGRLNVLMAMICRANARNRCWPSVETLCNDTGLGRATVNAASHWLRDHSAYLLVPYSKRFGEQERSLPVRQNIYELTGILKLDDGKVIPYLYLTADALKDAESSESESSESESSDSERKGSKGKDKDTKTRKIKDSSPKGDGPPAKEDSPSKSSKRDAYNDLVEAAVVAFKTSPAYARKIVAFLRNTLSDTDNRGRANDAWIEYMTEPKREITPALIRGFGQYWLTRHSDVSRPSSPEAIANNWHRYLMDESQAQFEKDGQLAIDLAAAKAAQAAAAAAVETETAATAATDGKVGTVEEQNAIFDRLLEAMRRFTE